MTEVTVRNTPSGSALWTARSLGTLAVLFLAFDAYGKFTVPTFVAEAFARQNFPLALAPVIGAILTVVTLLYIIPRTRVLGAVLLTGYLGGAVVTNLRAGDPAFDLVFPILFGVLIWAPLWLTDRRVRALLPLDSGD